jgi:CheY-like chemotaxis protein
VAQTVLIADDHADFRRLAARLLTAFGYEIVGEAVDGPDAVRMTRTLRPDILLLDVQMPGMSGFEVAGELADEPTEIVLISSREASDYGLAPSSASPRGFLTKRDLTGPALAEFVGPPA